MKLLKQKCDFNKVALLLYLSEFFAYMFSYRFIAYFHNTFF